MLLGSLQLLQLFSFLKHSLKNGSVSALKRSVEAELDQGEQKLIVLTWKMLCNIGNGEEGQAMEFCEE